MKSILLATTTFIFLTATSFAGTISCKMQYFTDGENPTTVQFPKHSNGEITNTIEAAHYSVSAYNQYSSVQIQITNKETNTIAGGIVAFNEQTDEAVMYQIDKNAKKVIDVICKKDK